MRYEVILDYGESPNRCTISPLADRPDFRLLPVAGTGSRPLGPFESPILLHPEGECLTRVRANIASIATIDCVWKRLPPLLARLAGPVPKLVRIPEGFVTAYPRVSRHGGRDPEGGLATIEAIFVAAALLGRWDETLLTRYYFGRRFVETNADRFRELGVGGAMRLPVFERRRDAWQRRIDRAMPRC
jgi:pre-rRNA-processing protein TSR3